MSADSTDVAAIPVARFQRLIGFRIVEWQAGRAVVSLDIREEHLNRAGSVHGGVLATLIDAAGGLSGNYNGGSEPPLPATSLTLVTSFLGSVRTGPIRAVGVRRGGGSRIFFASVDIFSEGGELLATGQGSYRLSASGATASAPRQGDPIEEARKAKGSR